MTVRRAEQGFTLIEVIVSLGLFALIAVAGLGLVDSVLKVQGRTEKRLDRLAQLQRAMFIISSDLDQIARGPLTGDATGIGFTRAPAGGGGAPQPIRYAVAGGTLVRIAGASPEVVLPGVETAQWRYFSDGRWVDQWPLKDADPKLRPVAVKIDMRVDGGTLRRVVPIPDGGKEKDQP